jgi:hypothetical protein
VLHIIRYRCPFVVGNGMQNWKCIFKGSITTLNILQKTNPRALARVKAAVTPKNLPTHTNVFPEAYPIIFGFYIALIPFDR